MVAQALVGPDAKQSLLSEPAYLEDKIIINLASQEYFNVVSLEGFKGRIVTPIFKEYKNGNYRPVHIFLKKARGYMTSYIVKNRITNPESLKLFDWHGYEYNANLSEGDNLVFTRG